MWKIKEKHPVFIVAHKNDPMLRIVDLPYVVIPNTGLEFGAYNHYLMNIWEGGNVLFTHDDVAILPTIKDYEIKGDSEIWDEISNLTVDQAYIFQNRAEDIAAAGMHGRMFFMSERLLEWFKECGGFWHDPLNTGYLGEGERPAHVMGYNMAINAFNERLAHSHMDVRNKLFIPSLALGKRGKFKGGIDPNEQHT
jgi:hypothetical protein